MKKIMSMLLALVLLLSLTACAEEKKTSSKRKDRDTEKTSDNGGLFDGTEEEEDEPDETEPSLIMEEPGSDGLEYVFDSETSGYALVGLGSCTDSNVVIASVFKGKPVTAIDKDALCPPEDSALKIENVTIPSSVVRIQPDALEYREDYESALSYHVYEGISYLGNKQNPYHALIGVEDAALSTYTIHPDTKVIAGRAFSDCANLTSITLPEGILGISEDAFFSCKLLTDVNIPDSVTYVGKSAFNYKSEALLCSIYENVRYLGNQQNPYLYLLRIADESLTTYTIHPDTRIIAGFAFENAENLTYVEIPEGVVRIGEKAFEGCDAFSSVTIPNSVTYIESYAFKGCKGLTEVNIPASVVGIGERIFSACDNLSGIFVDSNNSHYSSSTEGILFDKDKTVLITVPRTLSGKYVIPDTVTTLADKAFDDVAFLTDITIPASVVNIGEGVWEGCYRLQGIWVDPENPSYSSDSRGVLLNKDQSTLLRAPYGLVGEYAIPAGVTCVEENSFAKCTAITSVTVPNSVSCIRDTAFSGCSGLKSVTFPGDAPTFGVSHVFYQCVLTIYYNAGNPTWTADVMQSYGGTVKWEPMS